MQQEAAQELDRVQSHELGAAAVGIIFPLKTYAAIFKSAKAVVGDGDAVRVASQILEYSAGSTEGRLDVNHPIDGGGFFAQSLEGDGF
jgi:hypothetical protein